MADPLIGLMYLNQEPQISETPYEIKQFQINSDADENICKKYWCQMMNDVFSSGSFKYASKEWIEVDGCKNGGYFFTFHKGNLIGGASGKMNSAQNLSNIWLGDGAWIGWTGVIKKYQKTGVGRAMMTRVLKFLYDQGYSYVKVSTNAVPRGFYEKLGFSKWYSGNFQNAPPEKPEF